MTLPEDNASDTSEEVETHNNLFVEPEGYFPPTPPPTTQTYTLLPTTVIPFSSSSSSSSSSGSTAGDNNRTITLHLVGYSPTEAHHLWNGARVVSEYFEARPALVRGRAVLELGAGAGLPSLVAAVLGARRVVMTDYPDVEIVQTMWRNIDECALLPRRGRRNSTNSTKKTTTTTTTSSISSSSSSEKIPAPVPIEGQGEGKGEGQGVQREEDQDVILAKGFIWGADPTPLLDSLPDDDDDDNSSSAQSAAAAAPPPPPPPALAQVARAAQKEQKFDVLILADLLFRHTEHGHLLDTIRDTLGPDGKAFVFFTSYRPWLRHKDLAFFDLARERGFVVDKLLEKKMDRPMFENDPGDEEVRKTCTGWIIRWPSEE